MHRHSHRHRHNRPRHSRSCADCADRHGTGAATGAATAQARLRLQPGVGIGVSRGSGRVRLGSDQARLITRLMPFAIYHVQFSDCPGAAAITLQAVLIGYVTKTCTRDTIPEIFLQQPPQIATKMPENGSSPGFCGCRQNRRRPGEKPSWGCALVRVLSWFDQERAGFCGLIRTIAGQRPAASAINRSRISASLRPIWLESFCISSSLRPF